MKIGKRAVHVTICLAARRNIVRCIRITGISKGKIESILRNGQTRAAGNSDGARLNNRFKNIGNTALRIYRYYWNFCRAAVRSRRNTCIAQLNCSRRRDRAAGNAGTRVDLRNRTAIGTRRNNIVRRDPGTTIPFQYLASLCILLSECQRTASGTHPAQCGIGLHRLRPPIVAAAGTTTIGYILSVQRIRYAHQL